MSITAFIVISIIKSVIVLGILLTAVAYSVWLERKVSAHIQNRWGPTRVGPFGLLQPLADGVKFILKEELTAAACLQASLHRGADHLAGLCHYFDFGDSVWQLGLTSAPGARTCRLPT